MTDQHTIPWHFNEVGDVDLLGLCDGCQTPADEWPDTLYDWVIQIVTVEEDRTGLTEQQHIQCKIPTCPGHTIERRLYCPPCQKEHKYDTPPHPHS